MPVSVRLDCKIAGVVQRDLLEAYGSSRSLYEYHDDGFVYTPHAEGDEGSNAGQERFMEVSER